MMTQSTSQTTTDENFFKIMESEYALSRHFGVNVTLLYVKICKEYDLVKTYGKKTAKLVQRDIQKLICQSIRQQDRLFSYGHEGFMIILPLTSKDSAKIMARKLSAIITGYSFACGYDMICPMSPGFGVSSYPQDIVRAAE